MKPFGYGLLQQVERRDAVDRRHPQVLGAEAEGADGALRALVRRPEDVAVAGAHHGLLVQLVRGAETRRDVVGVPVVLIPAAPVDADEHDAALEIGERGHLLRERRRRIRIEVVHPVVSLRARHVDVVAQAEVERQPRVDPPVVLRVEGPVEAVGRDVLPVLDQHVVRLAEAEEQRREADSPPCCWRCWDSAPASRWRGS